MISVFIRGRDKLKRRAAAMFALPAKPCEYSCLVNKYFSAYKKRVPVEISLERDFEQVDV